MKRKTQRKKSNNAGADADSCTTEENCKPLREKSTGSRSRNRKRRPGLPGIQKFAEMPASGIDADNLRNTAARYCTLRPREM